MKLQNEINITLSEESVVDDLTVIAAEHADIAKRRGKRLHGDTSTEEVPVLPVGESDALARNTYRGAYDTIGLALSGGGVRSAAFCTGAMQGLAKHKAFEKIDYLSTVSGGGYAGLNTSIAAARGFGFPFLKSDEKQDTTALAVLRDNANYLKFGQLAEMLVNVLVYLRGVIANVLIIAPVLLGLAAFTLLINPTYEELEKPDLGLFNVPPLFGHFTVTTWLALLALGIFSGWACSVLKLEKAGTYPPFAKFAKYALAAAGLAAFFELQTFLVLKMVGEVKQPVVAQCSMSDMKLQCLDALPGQPSQCAPGKLVFACTNKIPPPDSVAKATPNFGPAATNLATYVAGVLAALSAFATFLSSTFGKYLAHDDQKPGILGVIKSMLQAKVLWWLIALALPMVFWLIYLHLVYWGLILTGLDNWSLKDTDTPWPWFTAFAKSLNFGVYGAFVIYFILSLALFLVSFYFLTANGNSPHRLYRERLGKAFCFAVDNNVSKSETDPVDCSDDKLSSLTRGPYHLVNTALNIAGDPEVNRRGRNADFFMFSPLYLGSKSTGYVKTKSLEDSGGGKHLNVATAMAVSGAAFSSNMGSSTIRLLRLTLAFFNVRLGYWFVNPKKFAGETVKRLRLYFLDEILGRLNTKAEVVYLSDGGHIENLGLYELLRRRCQLIVVVDAEADPGMSFGSFVTAQRYARIDLGAKINMKWQAIAARSLQAQKNQGSAAAGPHCAIGTIDYEGNGKGYILYVKSSVTGDENDYVRDYNRRFIAFPHETTADQFFSEEQFEAYRALGFHAVDGVLSGTHYLEDSDGKLSLLTDSGATADGISKVAQLLGITQEEKTKPPEPPTIHQIRLVSEAAQPFPLQLTVTTPPPPPPEPAPPVKGRKKRGSQ